MSHSRPDGHEARVLQFPSRQRAASPRAGRPGLAVPASPDDRARFHRHVEEGDDYRHRVKTNAATLVVIGLLIWAGLWLADSIAQLRKNQDCVLAGYRACTPLHIAPHPR